MEGGGWVLSPRFSLLTLQGCPDEHIEVHEAKRRAEEEERLRESMERRRRKREISSSLAFGQPAQKQAMAI